MTKSTRQETLQIKVSPSLKKQIRRCALDSDENLRTFVLKALQERGVLVPQDELVDRRKGPAR
jgi:uncharacterized protein (DUF1778 family)